MKSINRLIILLYLISSAMMIQLKDVDLTRNEVLLMVKEPLHFRVESISEENHPASIENKKDREEPLNKEMDQNVHVDDANLSYRVEKSSTNQPVPLAQVLSPLKATANIPSQIQAKAPEISNQSVPKQIVPEVPNSAEYYRKFLNDTIRIKSEIITENTK